MASASEFSVGLMHEVAVAGCEVGWEPKDFDSLKRDKPLLTNIRAVMRGTHAIVPIAYAVDCSMDPLLPTGLSLEEHERGTVVKLEKKGDELFVDGKKLELYLPRKQKKGSIEGTKLRKELKDKPVLNACILDYLLEHTELIPESWKKDAGGNTCYLFFWGTIYRGSGGGLGVRCLWWGGGGWGWSYDWLGSGWGASRPALLLASVPALSS